jgi:hypothetical protein
MATGITGVGNSIRVEQAASMVWATSGRLPTTAINNGTNTAQDKLSVDERQLVSLRPQGAHHNNEPWLRRPTG